MLKDILNSGSPSLFFMEGEPGGGGGGDDENKTWHASLPEDMREDPSLVDFKDETEMITMPVNVARSYINTKKLVGRDKIPMPKTDEEWSDTYNRLGRPEAAENYNIELNAEGKNEKLVEQLNGQMDWFKKTAHKHGLSEKQAMGFFNDYAEVTNTQVGDIQRGAEESFRESEIALRTEYGNSFEGKLVLMNRAIDSLDKEIPGLKEYMNDTGVGRDARMIKAFVKYGELIAEDLGIDKTTGEIAETPQALKDQKEELMKSPAYLDANDPAHNSTVQKVAALIEKISGSRVVEPTNRMTFMN